jgi:hypothetical protein
LHRDSETPSILDGFLKNKSCVRTHIIDLGQIQWCFRQKSGLRVLINKKKIIYISEAQT